MLEAAWLFAAIELNGALVSKGAKAMLDEKTCVIESAAIEPALAPESAATLISDGLLSTPAQHCEFDAAASVLKLTLPQPALATRQLLLSEGASMMNIALLHDPSKLSSHRLYAAQPETRNIPAAAFDIFLGSGLTGLGASLTHGPLSLQALSQRYAQNAALDRVTADYFAASGAHVRLGDWRAERGVDQRLGEYRGLLATNRAAPLRGDGKAEAFMALDTPSRVQFFDRHGTPVYSSEILPPGNYQIQGYGASTVPGFLEARLVDINGVAQSVTLAWSADRRLLSQDQHEWEVFVGHAREPNARLSSDLLASGRIRTGLTASVTAALHAEATATSKRFALEASTRQIPNLIATAALGQSCSDQSCQPEWLLEARYALSRQSHLLALLTHEAGQISLSGALSPRLSGTLSYAMNDSAVGRQHLAVLSGSLRLHPQINLQMQARHQRTEARQDNASIKGWSAFLGLSVYWSALRTSLSSTASYRSAMGPNAAAQNLNLQASYHPVALYGPQLQIARSWGDDPQSNGYFRYASPYGDASIRLSHLRSTTSSWSLSSRVWITSQGLTVSPTGEDNLVIQRLGQANIRIAHQGRDLQRTGPDGRAVFRKAPAWTDSTYSVDAKSIPFGMNLAASQVRIPLATQRAYLVDYRSLWSHARTWQIMDLHHTNLAPPYTVTDQSGRRLFMADDGYVDLHAEAALPIIVQGQQGQRVECRPRVPAQEDRPLAGHTEMTCAASAVL